MNNYYSTTNMHTAAAIMVGAHIDLDSIQRSENSEVHFLFEREEKLDDFLEYYWRRMVNVEPLSFLTAIEYLKDLTRRK